MFNIAHDKILHFFYGFFIYAISLIFLDRYYDLIPVFIIAIGKEIYDKITKKGTPEVMDFVYTIAPSVILTLIN